MSTDDRKRWDAKYAGRSVSECPGPDDWLVENLRGVAPGRALDLACGIGQNSVWLAGQGWHVDAVDVSPVGLQLGRQLATADALDVNWGCADLDDFTPEAGVYNLVLVFRFLDRLTIPQIVQAALCSGGLLVYETFTTAQSSRDGNHIRNQTYLLESEELPLLFPMLETVVYNEVDLEDRSVAQLVSKKPILE